MVRRATAAIVAIVGMSGALLVGLAPPASALGSVLYVSSAGSDAGACASSSSPCATITYALTQAAAGATINVAGTIVDHVVVNTPVTITGVGAPAGSPAVIDGSGTGRVFQVQTTTTFERLKITGGNANDSAGGGGMYIEVGQNVRLTGVEVSGNVSSNRGGGISSDGALVIADSRISSNRADGGFGGGGLDLASGTALIERSTFDLNRATLRNGGAINVGTGFDFRGSLTVRSSTLVGNETAGNGGGVHVSAASNATIESSTLTRNVSSQGGGVYVQGDAGVTVVGSTIADNDATFGGGVRNSAGNIKILGSIVASNSDNDCNVGTGGGTWVNEYSLINDAACGTGGGVGVVQGEALLGPAGPNGGPTSTMPLSVNSPAADAIPVGTTTNGFQLCPRTTQTGATAPTATAAACSMGAVEATGVVTAPINTLFVAAGGTDGTNTCTVPTSPCATLQRAFDASPSVRLVTIKVSGTVVGRSNVPAGGRTFRVTGAGAASPAVLDGSGTTRVIVNDAGADLRLEDLTVRNGTAPAGPGGGAILWANARLTLSGVTVSGSTASLSGGGIMLIGGDVLIERSTITGNTTGTCGGCTNMHGGGGIYAGTSTRVRIVDSTISGNRSQGGGNGDGGGLSNDGADSTVITGSTISGNTATQIGGGLILTGASTVTGSTITGNLADQGGGGIWVASGSVTAVTATTIANNTSNSSGGGVSVQFGTLNLGGSILAANTGGNCTVQTDANGPGVVSQGYNLDTGATCGLAAVGDVTTTPAGLGALASNGGRTQTLLPAIGSAAVNRIPSGTTLNGVAACPRIDQRGKAGPVSGQSRCTVGAVEPGAGTAPTFTSPTSRSATGGTRFSFPVTVTSPVTVSLAVNPASPLPAGVTFVDGGNGQGTLAGFVAPGTYAIRLIAANGVAPDAGQALTLTVAKRPQAPLQLTSLSGVPGSPLPLTTSGGSGSGAVTFTASNGTASGCTISGSTLTAATAGTCNAIATKAADASFFAVSSPSTSVAFGKADQALLTITSTSGTFATPLTLTTSGGTGTGAVTFAVVDGSATGCAVSGSTLTSTSPGTCIVTATKAADTGYNARSSGPTTVTLAKANQAALTVTSTNGTFATPLPLTTSGGSGTGAVTFTAVDGTATGCAVSGTTLTSTTAGSCTVTATKAADTGYNARSSPATTVTLAKANQAALTVTSTSGTAGTPLTLATSGGSGSGAVTFTAANGSATGCSISGATLTSTSAGTCTVTATKAADGGYNARSSPATTVTLAKAAQAALAVTSTSGTFGAPLTLATSGGSGSGAVTFAVTNGSASGCAVSGSTLTSTSAGTCNVTATKAGDATFAPQSSPSTTVSFAKSTQATLTVTSTNGTFATPLTLTTSGGSGTGAVTYAVVNGTATGCAVGGSTLTSTSAGTCTVTATKAGDASFGAGSSAPTTVTLAKATQAPLTLTSTSGTFATPLTLTTSGGSGTGAVSFAVVDGTASGCAVNGSTLTSTSAGTCTVTATKATDTGYNARSSAPTTVTLAKAAQSALTLTSTSGSFGTPLTLTTTGGSGTGAVTFTAANGTATGCTVSGSTLTATKAGTCTVTATKASDASYTATSSAPTTVTLARATQAAVTLTSSSGTFATPLALTASGGSGTGAVTFVAVDGTATGCSVSGSTLTSTSAGTCTVTATKAGDASFEPQASAPTAVALAKATQAALFLSSVTGSYGSPLALATGGGSGSGVVTFTAANGSAIGCAVSGSSLTSTSAGTCTVTATKAADAGYQARSSAPTTVTFGPAAGAYGPLSPARLLDTRAGGQGPCISGLRNLTVVGVGDVPADAAAVALNVTVTAPTAAGYLTVFPAGSPQPTASNLNYLPGQTVPNMVLAKVGAGGQVSIFTLAGCPQVIVDVVGSYTAGPPGPGGFGPLEPARLLDTRTPAQGPCVAGVRNLTVAGVGGVPADAAAVALNVTVTEPTAAGYLTVFPAGSPQPTASNLNYLPGQTVPNMVLAKVGAGGQISIFTPSGCPHVIVDVVGWFAGGALGTGSYGPLTPARLLDTRAPAQGPCVAGVRNLTVVGVGGVAANATAVALNVTVTESTAAGYVTVFPAGSPQPTASNLNYVAGQTVPNMVLAKVGAGGQISIFTPSGCPHVIVDVVGFTSG